MSFVLAALSGSAGTSQAPSSCYSSVASLTLLTFHVPTLACCVPKFSIYSTADMRFGLHLCKKTMKNFHFNEERKFAQDPSDP